MNSSAYVYTVEFVFGESKQKALKSRWFQGFSNANSLFSTRTAKQKIHFNIPIKNKLMILSFIFIIPLSLTTWYFKQILQRGMLNDINQQYLYRKYDCKHTDSKYDFMILIMQSRFIQACIYQLHNFKIIMCRHDDDRIWKW